MARPRVRQTSPVATVVVPAHDEGAVIDRCLRVLLSDARPGELAVLVVSNGSSDDTAEVARRCARLMGHEVEVLELAAAGKVGALRAGFGQVRHWPVIVLDADCELPTTSARALVAALDTGEPTVAAPRMTVTTASSAVLVRRFYRVWTALPYVREGMVGSGVFALNEAGWRRLGTLPDVTNDDGWVRRAFAVEERRSVPEPFVAHAARTTSALVSRRARIVNGNRQLAARLGADQGRNRPAGLLAALRRGAISPGDTLAFLAVTAATRAVATARRIRRDDRWAADRTSRAAA